MDRSYELAHEELQRLKGVGLFEKDVNLEEILNTAIPSRVQFFPQAVRDRQLRRARRLLLTGLI